jgi:uncharacterized membrane protein
MITLGENMKQHFKNNGYVAFTTPVGTTILSKKGIVVLVGQEEIDFWQQHNTEKLKKGIETTQK